MYFLTKKKNNKEEKILFQKFAKFALYKMHGSQTRFELTRFLSSFGCNQPLLFMLLQSRKRPNNWSNVWSLLLPCRSKVVLIKFCCWLFLFHIIWDCSGLGWLGAFRDHKFISFFKLYSHHHYQGFMISSTSFFKFICLFIMILVFNIRL